MQATLDGNQIPASGTAIVSSLTCIEYPNIGIEWLSRTGRDEPTLVEIAGIRGILHRRNPTQTLAFERLSPGARGCQTTVNQPVTVRQEYVEGDFRWPLTQFPVVFWAGRNGVGNGAETDASLYQRQVATLSAGADYLVLPFFNGEHSNDPIYEWFTSRWRSIAAAFPQNYYDIRRSFIDGAEAWIQACYPARYAKEWTMTFRTIGTGPVEDRPASANHGDVWRITAASGLLYDSQEAVWKDLSIPFFSRGIAAQDPLSNSESDVVNDAIPRAFRIDAIHLNGLGHRFFSELLAAELQKRGW
jgi:hypothetical protein